MGNGWQFFVAAIDSNGCSSYRYRYKAIKLNKQYGILVLVPVHVYVHTKGQGDAIINPLAAG